MNELFKGIFNTSGAINISIIDFMICMATAIIIGIFMAIIYSKTTRSSKSFIMTLALLPLGVTMVIIMVNGNIGAGVAVAGAFSLVRFRSMPGTAKEIGAIFIAMCAGLTIGMGYVAFAVLFSIIACSFSYILDTCKYGEDNIGIRKLQITIPENLNHSEVFEDIFNEYTKKISLITIKTTNMGSLFKLSYDIELNDIEKEKEFIDKLRCRNGNLEILLTKQELLNGL